MIRKWNIINDESNANYDVRNEIIYNTEILKSNVCGYNGITIQLHEYSKIVNHLLNVL